METLPLGPGTGGRGGKEQGREGIRQEEREKGREGKGKG